MFHRRTPPITLRRVAMMAALAALLSPAGSAEAAKKKRKPKAPVITSVSPLNLEVGDTLTIRGRYFRPGRGKNTVVFKRDGARAVFVKADVATKRMIRVKVPQRLVDFMANQGTTKVATRFRIRILATRFGKAFTPDSRSPMIAPDSPPAPPPPPTEAKADGDCDGDGVLNKDEADDDNDGLNDDVELSLPNLDPCKVDTDADGLEDRWEHDCDRNGTLNRDQADDDSDLLDDALENNIGTDGCSADTDGDKVEDGYEYKSAVDLNDDEYQQPQTSLPYPGKRPYANPLNADAEVDHDGDGLSLVEEYHLWKYTYEVNRTATRSLDKLSYSDGLQYSLHRRCSGTDCGASYHDGRRVPTQQADDYAKWFGTGDTNVCNGSPCNELGFAKWAAANGYNDIYLPVAGDEVSIFDANLDGDVSDHLPVYPEGFGDPGVPASSEIWVLEKYMFDLDSDGWVGDDERDEDADGLTNYDETHGRMFDKFWTSCYSEGPYPVKYAGTSHVDADSDGDGVRDGADDQDHDDVPNIMELSRVLASGLDDTEDGQAGTTGVAGPGMRACQADVDLPQAPETHHPDAYGWVNPFNPCLPDVDSRTCPRHPSFSESFAPFVGPMWYSLN